MSREVLVIPFVCLVLSLLAILLHVVGVFF